MADANLGQKLKNRYKLVELIGQGAMGKVYRAEDTLLGGAIVAVKFLSQTLLSDKMRDRFFREATTCAQLGQKSSHVVKVSDYDVSDEGVPFYVMEYLKGDSLSTLIHPQPLAIPRFMRLTNQICEGLKTAHEGINVYGYDKPVSIIHRDIKPSNIIVVSEPTLGEIAKILDFGIAKLMQSDTEQTSTFMGTLPYASPEQMDGKELDNRSDIYSLGVMMFQMLTGKLPLTPISHTFGGWYKAHRYEQPMSFDKASPRLHIHKLLQKLVMSCLEKEPEKRPVSAQAILTTLEHIKKRLEPGWRAVPANWPVKPPQPPPTVATPAPPDKEDTLCRLQSWPTDKPIAEIAFPSLIPTSQQPIATLWVMMSQAEIQKRQIGTRYNNFVCTMSPHPMLLWLTVLFSCEHGPKWIPVYLDLKTKDCQAIAFHLARSGAYRVLFFAKEKPYRCAHVVRCSVAADQKKRLQEWVLSARTRPSIGSPGSSKEMLKNELNNTMKGQILQRLEASCGGTTREPQPSSTRSGSGALPGLLDTPAGH